MRAPYVAPAPVVLAAYTADDAAQAGLLIVRGATESATGDYPHSTPEGRAEIARLITVSEVAPVDNECDSFKPIERPTR